MVERKGIKSAGELHKQMVEVNIPTNIASHLVKHEYYGHAVNDEVGKGEFGFRVGAGWIVAYYLILGDRTPEQLMKIAEGPGRGEMSDQDWRIYNNAFGEWLREQQKDGFEKLSEECEGSSNSEENENEFSKLELVRKFAGKLEELERDGRFPGRDELIYINFRALVENHWIALRWAYSEALKVVGKNLLDKKEDNRKLAINYSETREENCMVVEKNGLVYISNGEEIIL